MVTEGNVLVTTRRTSYYFDDSWVVAQNLSTGAELWRVKLPISFDNSWASAAYAVRDGVVYAGRTSGGNLEYVYALSVTDGSIIWRSQDLVDEYMLESPTFAPNGDIIFGNFHSLLRINHTDGTTVWSTPRLCPSSGGCAAAVSGDRVYAWDIFFGAQTLDMKVSVFDIATGAKLYSKLVHQGSDTINQMSPMAGPNGTVYAPNGAGRPDDAFISFHDTGSALIEQWRVPMGFNTFASFGIGPDGTVYSYSRDNRVIRLDPATGVVLNSSNPIPWETYFMPRMAIDSAGKVFVTNGSLNGGAIFALNPDLTLRWSDALVAIGSPAIGQFGFLVVSGTSDVRAYFDADPPGVLDPARLLRSGESTVIARPRAGAPPSTASR